MGLDYLLDTNACVCGDPDRAIEMFRAYEATGCDVVFCLFNPYDVAHADVMQTIELMVLRKLGGSEGVEQRPVELADVEP